MMLVRLLVLPVRKVRKATLVLPVQTQQCQVRKVKLVLLAHKVRKAK
jgi:hypothetical protein